MQEKHKTAKIGPVSRIANPYWTLSEQQADTNDLVVVRWVAVHGNDMMWFRFTVATNNPRKKQLMQEAREIVAGTRYL